MWPNPIQGGPGETRPHLDTRFRIRLRNRCTIAGLSAPHVLWITATVRSGADWVNSKCWHDAPDCVRIPVSMPVRERLPTICETMKLSQSNSEKRTGLVRPYISRVENRHTVSGPPVALDPGASSAWVGSKN